MKIAYLIPYIANSGPVNVVRYLCDELKKEHEIDLYYFKNIVKTPFPVKAQRIGLTEKIDFDQYDIIHSHGVLPDAYVWLHRRAIKKAKTVTTLHNYVKEDYKYAYNPIKAYVLERVWNLVTSRHDKVVTLSRDAVIYYRKFWKNKNLTFIYNGIPSGYAYAFRSGTQMYPESRCRKIGLIGSGDITARKGFDQPIRALKYLPNCEVYIAGRGQQIDNLTKLAKEVGVEERVHFLGFQKDIASFIESMDIFVVPSRSEGCPLVLLEIARSGKPVVCSDIPIMLELFSEDEVTFFPLENIEELALSIEKIYAGKEAFGNKIFQKYLSSYTSAIMADNYLKLYQNTIAGSQE